MTLSKLGEMRTRSKTTGTRLTLGVPHLKRDLNLASQQIIWKGSVSNAKMQFANSTQFGPFIEVKHHSKSTF